MKNFLFVPFYMCRNSKGPEPRVLGHEYEKQHPLDYSLKNRTWDLGILLEGNTLEEVIDMFKFDYDPWANPAVQSGYAKVQRQETGKLFIDYITPPDAWLIPRAIVHPLGNYSHKDLDTELYILECTNGMSIKSVRNYTLSDVIYTFYTARSENTYKLVDRIEEYYEQHKQDFVIPD